MKSFIFEDDIDTEKIKKYLFKYWDKYGVNISKDFFTTFNLKGFKKINQYIDEWYGKEKMEKIMDDIFFREKVYQIEDCGSYNMTFEVKGYEVLEDTVMIYVKIIHGTMRFIFSEDPDRVWTFDELNHHPDIDNMGGEIDNEIRDCITEYFIDEIRPKFYKGVDVVLD